MDRLVKLPAMFSPTAIHLALRFRLDAAKTNRIPVNAARSSIGGRPPFSVGEVCLGINGLIRVQSSSFTKGLHILTSSIGSSSEFVHCLLDPMRTDGSARASTRLRVLIQSTTQYHATALAWTVTKSLV